MPLTDQERDFLGAFIHEPNTDRYKGPATESLHRLGIFSSDLLNLLAAYYRENPAGQEGLGGQDNPDPPPSPWPTREAALRRDQELQCQFEPARIPRESDRTTASLTGPRNPSELHQTP